MTGPGELTRVVDLRDHPAGPSGRGAGEAIPVGVSRPGLGLVDGTEVLADHRRAGRALHAAVAWVRDGQVDAGLGLDGPSGTVPACGGLDALVVGSREVDRWVHDPADVVLAHVRGARARAGLEALRARLVADLAGRTVVVAEGHGPLEPARWWFDAEAAAVVVVDGWGPAGAAPVEVDELRLVLARRGLAEQGTATASAHAIASLLTDGLAADEQVALGPGWPVNEALSPTTLVLLAWLHDVAARYGELDRSSGSRPPRSLQRDVDALLHQLAPGRPLAAVTARDAAGLRTRPETSTVSAAERSTEAVSAAVRRADGRAASRIRTARTLLGCATGVALWLAGTVGIDPAAMGDLGLLSILRPAAYLGLAVLLATFGAELAATRPATGRLAAPLVTLVAVLHGTPAWLYGLRYSWAWKHLGIIDYIHRNGAVDPHAQALDVYHNWPGFFALNSALVDLFGLDDAVPYARWWPVAANLAAIPALLFVYRGLQGGTDRRRGWTAVGLFLVANWIGQDYFSPQSMGFLLYLVVVGVALQCLGRLPVDGERIVDDRSRRWAIGVAIAASAAMITSHQVTPFVLIVALIALGLARQARTARLAVTAVLLAALWSATGAWTFIHGNLSSLAEGFGTPVDNADQNLVDQGRLGHDQVVVSTMGRVALVAIGLLALWGIARELRRRRVDLAALALLGAPITLVAANTFGGEIGFRAYLFALPILAWYGAAGLWPPAGRLGRPASRHRARVRAVAVFAAASVLLAGFLFGYYGKDRWYSFSADEVAATRLVMQEAPAGSLLVTFSANYPGPAENYDNLVYVPITSEPADSRAELLADPVDRLADWLGESGYTGGYVLITRAQEREIEALGLLPPGSVARVRRALAASPRFVERYRSDDAQVFTLADRADGG
jgi:hypothetical protein